MNEYPRLTVDLPKLRHNVRKVVSRCKANNMDVAGVIKGCNGLIPCARAFAEEGCDFLASSRMEQLEAVKKEGITVPLMLVRIPMISELSRLVETVDISLQSEKRVLEALEGECVKQGKKHRVILMADLGDLREGFWDRNQLIQTALAVESFSHVHLAGVGTNLGCYGSIAPTVEKLEELVDCARNVEEAIGRKLDYISGGATSSFPRLLEDNMPEGINHLRIGELILEAKDLEELWGYDLSSFYQNVFTLEAEVLEKKEKPSHPVGEVMFDAFGHRPTYEDIGVHTRALVAMGKMDYAYLDGLSPVDRGIRVLGASSDHTILDVTRAHHPVEVGSTVKFHLNYGAVLFLTNSPNVKIRYREE